VLTEYIKASLKKAEYKKLEDGSWYAEIPGFTGVWANSESVEECRNELQEVLGEWLILKIRDKDPIATVDGLDIKIVEKAVA
jgi:predicted RNase H-like HicB family nuclease